MKDFTPSILNPLAPGRTFVVVGNHYINLALVQRIEAPANSYGADANTEAAVVYFVSGDSHWFYKDDAAALRKVLESAAFRAQFVRFDAAALPIMGDDAIWMNAAQSLEARP